jgi:predicted small lipoprotein YifL
LISKWSLSFVAGVAFASTLLAGCGQKGPLYLPSEATEIVTRPAPTATGQSTEKTEAPNTPQSVDSPQQPPNPAPEVTAPDKDKKQPATPAPRQE